MEEPEGEVEVGEREVVGGTRKTRRDAVAGCDTSRSLSAKPRQRSTSLDERLAVGPSFFIFSRRIVRGDLLMNLVWGWGVATRSYGEWVKKKFFLPQIPNPDVHTYFVRIRLDDTGCPRACRRKQLRERVRGVVREGRRRDLGRGCQYIRSRGGKWGKKNKIKK